MKEANPRQGSLEASKARIYLDYAASTPLSVETKEIVSGLFGEYGNPSSVHKEGVIARSRIEGARKRASRVLGVLPQEIYFTSGSTEGLNIAIRGVVAEIKKRLPTPHIITSAIEHPAILETLRDLERNRGVSVDYLVPQSDGIVPPADFQKALKKETALIAFSLVNSEIGTLLPEEEYVRALRHFRKNTTGEKYPYILLDATQSTLCYEINAEKLSADLLVLDGSKMGALAGSGLLYVRRGVEVAPILSGGGQERGLRPGTQNLLGIETLVRSLEISGRDAVSNRKNLSRLSQIFLQALQSAVSDCVVNGSLDSRSPHITNICFPGVDAEWLVLQLDAAGVSVSRGSACKSGKGNESEVLGLINPTCKENSIRFSFGSRTTENEIEKTVEIIRFLVKSGVSFY